MIYIYGLIERNAPVKGIRYIGLTNDPDSRLSAHRRGGDGTSKEVWVSDLRSAGDTIDMVILEKVRTKDEAVKAEAAWIKFAQGKGWAITNTIKPHSEGFAFDADWGLMSDYIKILIESVIDARKDIISHAFDIRRDLLGLRSGLSESVKAKAKSNKRSLIGAIRQSVIGAALLVTAMIVSGTATILGIDASWFVSGLIVLSAIMAIYPLGFILWLCTLWLFGRELSDYLLPVNSR